MVFLAGNSFLLPTISIKYLLILVTFKFVKFSLETIFTFLWFCLIHCYNFLKHELFFFFGFMINLYLEGLRSDHLIPSDTGRDQMCTCLQFHIVYYKLTSNLIAKHSKKETVYLWKQLEIVAMCNKVI